MSKVANPAYQEKVVVARAIRAEIKPFLSSYYRVFTEPRKDGLRSKFWVCGIESPRKLINAVKRLKTMYPQYKIEVHGLSVAGHGYGWGDVSLYIYDKNKKPFHAWLYEMK